VILLNTQTYRYTNQLCVISSDVEKHINFYWKVDGVCIISSEGTLTKTSRNRTWRWLDKIVSPLSHTWGGTQSLGAMMDDELKKNGEKVTETILRVQRVTASELRIFRMHVTQLN
jgi:hypothetical protein